MRRHFLAGAAIDDDRLVRAEAPGGAGGVERGVAAAVDDDLPAEERRRLALHRAQKAHGIENLRRAAGRDIGAPGDMGADGEEGGVVAALAHRGLDVVDLGLEHELDAHMRYPPDLGVEHVARQAVFRDAEAHHAAGERPGLTDRHAMAETAQVIGGREARRTRADHEHALARLRLRLVERPALGDRDVAKKPLDRIDPDRFVDLSAVAGGFARMVADAPHHRGQRVVLRQRPPRGLVFARLRVTEPALDVLARRARGVARGQPVDIDRPLRAPRAGEVELARADVERDGVRVFHLTPPASTSP